VLLICCIYHCYCVVVVVTLFIVVDCVGDGFIVVT